MAESTSKRRKEEENAGGDTDRISSLPDSVLLQILAFLPTKTCVATSVLSRRWRHLWEHVQVLDFCDESHGDEDPELFQSFAVFVNSVLLLRNKSLHIRKLRLSCGHSLVDTFYAYSVDTWLRAAIGPHLEELHLTLFAINDHGFFLSLTLLTCTNLVSLSLCDGILVHHAESATAVSLPSLKILKLNIGYAEVASVNALLSGCPILETLDLCFSPQCYDGISVPSSVKWLKINIENDVYPSLEIDAPGLKYLNLTNMTFGLRFRMYNLHNVVEAFLDLYPPAYDSLNVIPLLQLLGHGNLSGTKHLVLSRSTTKSLFGSYPDLHFSVFRQLLHLELILPSVNSNSLLSLLHKCHVLQVLIIQNDKEQSPLPRWAPQPSAPSCLISHLTFFHFKGYQGFADELRFAEYILQKGLVLKTMIIDDISLDLRKKYNILKRLSLVPRGSAMCELKFD